ncbi:MAG: ABC transporter permease [Deltaproteobacteria bacterium]|nr:ABC transporter permease [Deltaproteobacteria bacterium]
MSHSERMITRIMGTIWGNKTLLAGLIILAALVFTAVFAPWITPYDPYEQNLHNVLKTMSWSHPLGTDEFGRDILSRIFHGTRITLFIVCVSVLLGGILGCFLGIIAGYVGKYADNIIMRLMDIPLAFPGMLLALAIVEIVGKGIVGVIIATSVFSVPQFARLVRALILSARESMYIQAARALGESSFDIVLRYILPNIWPPILVLASIRGAIVILVACALSFLGLGVQPPTTEWGAMIAAGKIYLVRAPHLTLFPGLVISLTVFSFNLIGDALRDIMDVKLN